MKKITIVVRMAVLVLLSILAQESFSQTQYFVLQEIIHNRTNPNARLPDKIEFNENGGFIEFSVIYNTNCTERYRFDVTFDQDMRVMESLKEYGFNSSSRILSGNCNPSPNRDPYMAAGAANGATSALIGSAGYGLIVNGMGMANGWDRLSVKGLYGAIKGSLRGAFMGQSHNRVGAHTYLRFQIEGPSNIGYDNGFYYEILFVYKIEDTPPTNLAVSEMACPPPDCSGFPGTVPVWNYQTQRGECWCPEGTVWDKMDKKCVVNN